MAENARANSIEKVQKNVKAEGKTDQAAKNRLDKKRSRCPVSKKCGGCTMIDVPYERQTQEKQQFVEDLIGTFGRVDPIIRMKNPDHYRNKVTSVFAPDKKGHPVCGIYKAGTHEVVPVKSCLLEDLRADRIIQTVISLMESFKLRVYDEDRGTGLIRYVQVRTAHSTRQVMVTLVTGQAVFPPACGIPYHTAASARHSGSAAAAVRRRLRILFAERSHPLKSAAPQAVRPPETHGSPPPCGCSRRSPI